MSLLCCLDTHHHIHVAAIGATSLTEWQEGLARVAEIAAPPGIPILINFSSATHLPQDWELPLLAFLLRRLTDHRRCRLAIHSAVAEHSLSLAMLAFSCDAPATVEVFHCIDRARTWLQQPHPA